MCKISHNVIKGVNKMNDLKDMLIYLRKREGLTQSELANKVGVSKSTIAMWEAGTRYPSRESEEALADIFNVNLSTLRGKDEAEPTEENAKLLATIMKDGELAEYIKKLVNMPLKKREALYKYIDFLCLED